jgi:anti-sigma factor RsiW
MPEFLDADELRVLTGFKPAAKQDAWLRDKGIPHRRDGKRLIVSRQHVRAWLEGRLVVSSNGPNWSAVA